MSRTLSTAFMILVLVVRSGQGQDVKSLFKADGLEVAQRIDRNLDRNGLPYNFLLKERVYFGLNYLRPENKDWRHDPEKDLSRLATTYWHKRGPLGVFMEKFNWFPGPANTYHADARLPASVVGLGACMQGSLPIDMLAAGWSEPAIGRVGMEVGTVASYVRPLQYFDIFDPNPTLIGFSLGSGKKKETYFQFVKDAQERGAAVRAFEGDPRPTMAKKAPRGFYHALIVEPYKNGVEVLHEDLLTREGVALCMDMLADDGVLCIHISNRHYNLSKIYADIAVSLKLACIRGHDMAPDQEDGTTIVNVGQFTSEWILMARDPKLLQRLEPPAGYEKGIDRMLDPLFKGRAGPDMLERYRKEYSFWSQPQATGKHLWTDRGPHSFAGLYYSDPAVGRLRVMVSQAANNLNLPGNYTRAILDLLKGLDSFMTDYKNGTFIASFSRSSNSIEKPLFKEDNLDVTRARNTSDVYSGPFNRLLKEKVHFGLNYVKPQDVKIHGDPEKDLSRLATTYWHRRGPLGQILERFNWFPGPVNTYYADARLPVSLIGAGCALPGSFPVEMLCTTWSEPPIGRVGMEIGTVASYARPFQHLDIFETDRKLIGLSLGTPENKNGYFHYVQDAKARGANVRVFEGDLRPTLAKKAGRGFYHVLIVEPYKHGVEFLHEDLMTKEGVAMCMDLLAPDGILCIHISNRYYELAPIYADIAASLKLTCVLGRDTLASEFQVRSLDDLGRFTSEWIIISRKRQDLKTPAWYEVGIKRQLDDVLKGAEAPDYRRQYLKKNAFWSEPRAKGQYLWTDDGPHSFAGLYRRDPLLAEVSTFLRDVEYAVTRNLLTPRQQIRSWGVTAPLYDALEELNRKVVLKKNRGFNPGDD